MPDRIRALYVDDEPGLLEVARLFLEQSPEFRVETAESAMQALNSTGITSCDAIVSDYQMPGMDGIAFLKAVREKYGDIPFILFTGRGREEVVIQAINNGADFYIQKGGDPTAQFAELAHKIRQAVSRKRAQDQLKLAYEQITASEEELRGQYGELAQGERRIRESQELLRTFLESATDAFSIWDADLNLVDMNTKAMAYLPAGIKKEDVLGKNLQEFLSGEGPLRSIDQYREVQKTGIPVVGTESMVISSSGTHWLNVKCFRVGGGLGIMTTDVTREKEAEEKLKAAYDKLSASEEKLRHQYEEIAFAQQSLLESREQMTEIAETVPGVVYQSLFLPGENEKFTFLSRRVPEVFGISAEREGFTERFFACVDPRDRERIERSIRETVAKAAPWEFEGRFIKPSGEAIWFQGLARPVRKAAGLYYNGVLLDITSRKRAEEAVIEQAAKLREAQEMAHLGFWSWDIRTGNVEWSDEVFRIFGLDAETFRPTIDSILARSPWPEEQNRAREIVQKATESHKPGSYEQRFLRPDNSTGYYYSTYQGRYDEKGNLISVVGTVLDITSRKKAEIELRASEDRYRSIIEYAPYGMHFYRLDPGRGLIFVGANPVADRILGVSHDQFIGKTIEDAFPGLAGSEIPPAYRKVAETGETWKTVNVYYKDGRIHGAFDVTAFRTAPDSMAAMFVDITEQKKAEEALRTSEERFRLFIQQAPVAIAMFDEEMRYLAASRRWMADFHLGDTDVTGRSHYEIFPDLPEELKGVHRRGLAGEVISSEEDRFVRGDGSVQWLTWEVRPWYTTGNTVGGIIIYSEDISTRKKAEEALREKTEELDRFFTASLDLFCIAGTDGIFRRLNPEWERALGYTLAELEGHRFLDFVHPDDLGATRAAVGDLNSQKSVLNFTNRYRHKDGSYRWIEWRSFPRGDLVFAAARDITERKQFEDALQQSRAELSAILEGTPVLQFVIGRDHRIIAWNKALEKYSGVPATEVVGTDLQWRAFYAVKRPVLADLLVDNNTDDLSRWYGGKLNPAPHVEGGYEATDFFPAMGPSGTWLMFTAAPVRDADGTIIGAVETLSDVTDRVRATEALRESEEKYRSLVDVSPVAVAVHRGGKVVYANPEAVRLLKAGTAEDLIGKDVLPFIHPDYHTKALEDFRLMAEEGRIIPLQEEVLLTLTGEPFTVEVVAKPIQYEGLPSFLVAFRDITERKLAEAALREAGQKLALLNSVTRHDIRNQLITLQGFTQFAMKNEKDPAIAGYLAKVDTSATLIRGHIEFMKAYQELGVDAPSWIRVDEVACKVQQKEVTCQDLCSGIEIFSDPMLEKVFSNLYENALRHGEHVTEIAVRCEISGDGLVVVVEDNGIGISEDEKEKIFLKGYGKNTGYGLFLAREILSITGISLRETGTYGKGARFEIQVPRRCWRMTGS